MCVEFNLTKIFLTKAVPSYWYRITVNCPLWDSEHKTALYQSFRFVCSRHVHWPNRLDPFPNHGFFLYVPVPRTDDTALCRGVCTGQWRGSPHHIWHTGPSTDEYDV